MCGMEDLFCGGFMQKTWDIGLCFGETWQCGRYATINYFTILFDINQKPCYIILTIKNYSIIVELIIFGILGLSFVCCVDIVYLN